MKAAALVLLVATAAFAADRGLPARSSPDHYTGKVNSDGTVLAAEVIPPDQVRNEFSTTLAPRYQVIEVALYPENGADINVEALDFGLRVDGRLIRPASPRTIAARNQKRSKSRTKDVLLYPSVGVSTGTWGTGTNVGVGVGMGDGAPGPGSTDQDRRVMETELDDRGLQEGITQKAIAGYLYFPVGETKATTAELVYQQDAVEVKIPLNLPKDK